MTTHLFLGQQHNVKTISIINLMNNKNEIKQSNECSIVALLTFRAGYYCRNIIYRSMIHNCVYITTVR